MKMPVIHITVDLEDRIKAEIRAIQALEECADDYATIRDERMALSTREIDLKKRVRTLMHQHKKTRYARNGIEIELLPPDGEEGVRVRIRKPKTDKGESADV